MQIQQVEQHYDAPFSTLEVVVMSYKTRETNFSSPEYSKTSKEEKGLTLRNRYIRSILLDEEASIDF